MKFSSTEFREQLKPMWQLFLKEFEPLRTELFGLGMKLTSNPFDAEDLVADSLLKAFTYRAIDDNQIDNPRGFITKIMVNAWIDQNRRASTAELLVEPIVADRDPSTAEIAADRLFLLPARARAVVVLKEFLGYSHEEIARMLSITPSNAKVILHRAKSRLSGVKNREARASRECVQRFVEAFLTYDVDKIRKVLIEDVVADNFPVGSGTGIEHHIENGWVKGSFFHHNASNEASQTPSPLELEVHDVCGEHVVLVFRGEAANIERALEEVWRLEEVDGQVAKIVDYCFREDLVRWVADLVGVLYRPMQMG